MKGNGKIIIGYAPTRRNVFSIEEAIKYKKLILNKIKKYGFDIVGIEDIHYNLKVYLLIGRNY